MYHGTSTFLAVHFSLSVTHTSLSLPSSPSSSSFSYSVLNGLIQGDVFGELGVLTKEQVRTATIRCEGIVQVRDQYIIVNIYHIQIFSPTKHSS